MRPDPFIPLRSLPVSSCSVFWKPYPGPESGRGELVCPRVRLEVPALRTSIRRHRQLLLLLHLDSRPEARHRSTFHPRALRDTAVGVVENEARFHPLPALRTIRSAIGHSSSPV